MKITDAEQELILKMRKAYSIEWLPLSVVVSEDGIMVSMCAGDEHDKSLSWEQWAKIIEHAGPLDVDEAIVGFEKMLGLLRAIRANEKGLK